MPSPTATPAKAITRHLGIFDGPATLTRQLCLQGTSCSEIAVEIGPGDCGFILPAAITTPSTLWIGMERRRSSLSQARNAHEVPENARLIDTDGRWVVENLIAPAAVDAYHIYFPDPWWKKRHHKRRLFRPQFCEAVYRTLSDAGSVYVMTDVTPRYTEIREALLAAGFSEHQWSRLDDARIANCQSSYERKYRRQGRSFHEARFEKA